MCWSLEVSLLSGCITYATGVYLIRRNVRWDRASAVFIMAIGAMQFVDALLWWDGMAVKEDGTCSTMNWFTSYILVQNVLRVQIAVRHMELGFRSYLTSLAVLCASLLLGYMVGGAASPSLAGHYFSNIGCSKPAPILGSPLWGGLVEPLFCFVIWLAFTIPPLLQSQRVPEAILYLVMCATALSLKEAWSSKYCSIANLMTIYHICYSGPALLSFAYDHKTREANGNALIALTNTWEKFLYGSAKAKEAKKGLCCRLASSVPNK